MRTILAAVAVALLTTMLALQATPSAAQQGRGGGRPGGDGQKVAPKKPADDKGYKAAIEGLPDQKFDPWRNLR